MRRLRFAEDDLHERFPIILASDVTYLRELWPKLLICLEQHLTPGGAAYLSDPYRSICTEFLDWLQTQAWHVEVHRVEMADDPQKPIRVMKLTLKSGPLSSCLSLLGCESIKVALRSAKEASLTRTFALHKATIG